jgi:predicted transcriptional regulator
VQRRMDGRSIRFTPVGTQGAHAAMLMREALSDGGRHSATALRHFAQTLSPEEAAALRTSLDTFDKRRAGSSR